MADLSLDEFIKQKNVKVQFRNTTQPRGQIQRKNLGANKFQAKSVTVQRTFDARSKLGPKAVVDARDKIIINKKSGKGDARNKIVQKQVQKGTFDARSLLKKQTKTNGAAINNPQKQSNNFQAVQPLTRTLSNTASMGQSGIQVTRPVPGNGVSFSGDSLQITRKGAGMGFVPTAPALGDAVPIIQIRNDRYQQRQQLQPQQPSWPNQSQRLPQPAHVPFSHQPSSHPHANRPVPFQNRYQDLDDPNFNNKPPRVQDIPKMHISNIKAVEAAGMRPVSARPAPPQPRVPPGAASLSAKQPVTMFQQSSTGALKRRQPAQEVSGPLRLGKGGGPGLSVGIGQVSPPKRVKTGTPNEPIEIVDEDHSKFVSPIQGFRVVVTNLFAGVTQDDIIELFGVVGPLKKARLLKAGSAEVVYSGRDYAVKAVQKYHGRELDGLPMYVKMTTPSTAVVKSAPGHDPDITGEALRLYKKPSSLGALPEGPIEVPTIHRALFKVGPPAPNKSVKFTVKI